jgi:hypothetical protein
VEMTGNGDRYLYRERGVLAVVGPMGRGSSGWGGGSEWGSWCGGGGIREVVRSRRDPIGPTTASTPLSRYKYWSPFPFISTLHIQPLKMEKIDGFETSAFKNQKPGIHPKDYSQYPKKIFLRLRWSRGKVLAFATQVRGFAPGRSRWIFLGGGATKSSARLPSEGE